MSKSWELTIYADGIAILTDHGGRTVWTSDGDDDFAGEGFPDVLDFDDGDAIMEYLVDSGVVDEDEDVDIVEADSTGLREVLAGDEDEDEDADDDEDEDA